LTVSPPFRCPLDTIHDVYHKYRYMMNVMKQVVLFGGNDERSDTRRNRFSRGVVVRFWGGRHVANESARQRAECGAGPWGLGGRVRVGRRLQGAEEERLCRDDRSGGDHVAR